MQEGTSLKPEEYSTILLILLSQCKYISISLGLAHNSVLNADLNMQITMSMIKDKIMLGLGKPGSREICSNDGKACIRDRCTSLSFSWL